MGETRRVAIDSNLLIDAYGHRDQPPPFLDKSGLAHLLTQVEGGGVVLVCSAVVMLECLSVSVEILRRCFDGVKGHLATLDHRVAEQARRLSDECHDRYGRRLGHLDAIHLATAGEAGCHEFVTRDQTDRGKDMAPAGAARGELERMLGLKIVLPRHYVPDQMVLLEESDPA